MLKYAFYAAAASLALVGPVTPSTAGEPSASDEAMAQSVEAAKSQADHEAIAQSYEAEAAKFDQAAARHVDLAKHYEHGHGANPKGNPAAMAQHCNTLAKNLKGSADEAREMARLHREMGRALAK